MGNLLRDTVELLRQRKAGKRELSRIPRDEMAIALHEGWVARFWNLPPEAWKAAVDLRVEASVLRQEDNKASWNDYRSRDRTFWRQYEDSPDPNEERWFFSKPATQPPATLTAEEIEELRQISEEISEELGAGGRVRTSDLEGKMLEAAEKIKQAEKQITANSQPLGEPWESWIAELPEVARHDARLACLLWRDMIRLRHQLREVIEERRVLTGIDEVAARQILMVRMFELRGRINACDRHFSRFEPFFVRYGKPPLAESEMDYEKRRLRD